MTTMKRLWLATTVAAVGVLGMAGCNGCNSNTPAPITNAQNGADPANANLATPDGGQPTQVMGQSAAYAPQQSGEAYGPGQQAPAPIVNGNRVRNEAYNYNTQAPDDETNGYYDSGQPSYDQGYSNGEADAYAQVSQAPPELPLYEQPPAPDPDDIWTPGYWGYANTGYYWNPGVWVAAPFVGALWTPGYWGNYGGHYRWHHGFWGRHIGYYGGINYGCGYIGSGYYGGYWNRDHFYYNNAVTRVSPRVTNVYERNVVVNNVRYTSITENRVSYNGGRGGVNYQPRPYEVAAMHEQHVGPVPAQQQFHREAAMNRANFYADNHGRPAQLALAQPVRTERIAAPPEVNRGGFGRNTEPSPGAPRVGANPVTPGTGASNNNFRKGEPATGAAVQPNIGVHNENGARPLQAEQQQRTAQNAQQHPEQTPQRGLMQPGQRGAQPFTPNQNTATEQQRALQAQTHINSGQREAMEVQRMQQRQEPMQQAPGNRALAGQQPRTTMQPQRTPQQLQQPHLQPQPQRSLEQPRVQPQAQAQPRMEQPRPQAMPQPRQQFNAQPRMEQRQIPTPQQQQHMEAPRAMPGPAPRMEAPHAAPAPAAAPHMGGPPAGGGGHPGGGHR